MRISAEQVALRWRPTLRQTDGLKIQPVNAQVRQDLLNHLLIFDAGNDFHAAMFRFTIDCPYCKKKSSGDIRYSFLSAKDKRQLLIIKHSLAGFNDH